MNLSPITTEEARAELLQINRGTLRALHNMNRIDWNKPHAILKLYPPFTRQTIRKAAAAAGYPAALRWSSCMIQNRALNATGAG